MMFSSMPALVNAQKKCPDGNCPKGQTCLNGHCVKFGGTICNCFVRPIPYGCGQICGWLTPTIINNPGSQSATISFSLSQNERISAKIFDNTGRLVTTLADKMFEQGEHKLQWDAMEKNAGIYMVQFITGSHSEMKKITIIK